uniref:Kinase-like domain,concanavalin A-like lectin/glucanase domain protein n=1 Tax=Tanacetum cinerariifolium TaxID=118510 RepID=A0A6L2MHS1_TANCI|nr:kinase-like domain,concanavalin A-like lectin/glucanase domain protein [Tanacetum cinerariifolium]
MASTITEFADLQIPLEDIVKATNNFADENIIGRGGFGYVYEGKLLVSGKLLDISARRLDRSHGQGDVEFWTEISMLSSLKHQLIVFMIGFCDEKSEKVIIYRYYANGSLSMHLTDPTFTWSEKFKICATVAEAIDYIHTPDKERSYRVIHHAISSSTILLDKDWEPYLSGFEYSIKHSVDRKNQTLLSEAIDTRGYIDPAIEKTGGVTHKSDVYSFGVVLFKVLCGRRAFIPNEDNRFLAQLAKSHYENEVERSQRPNIELVRSNLIQAHTTQRRYEETDVLSNGEKNEAEQTTQSSYLLSNGKKDETEQTTQTLGDADESVSSNHSKFPNQTSIYTPTAAYVTHLYGTSPRQEYMLEFTSEYGISEALHLKLPGPGERIVDFPEGKVGWMSFSKRPGKNTPQCYTKPLDSLKTGTTDSSGWTEDMDLFNLIRAPNPTKVKTGTRRRAAHEVPLLTVTASRVIEMEDPAVATDSSGEAVAPEVPPPENMTTTGVAPEAGQMEGMAATSPHVIKERRKRGDDGFDTNAPPKGAAAAGDPKSENTSFTSMVRSSESIYQPEWGVTNDCRLDAPEACQDLVDHIAPPGYFSEPRHLHNDDFLKQYNVNLARQVAMGSQLRLRFEQEAKLLKKSVAQVARRDKRIQVRENEIKNLETLVEAETDMKKTAEGKSVELSKDLKNLRVLFSDLQVSNDRLSQQVSTLQAQVTGEEKLKAAFEEFKQYEDNRVEKRCTEMDARLDALSIDFDEELYPHILTAIAGRRWVIGHGLRLAVMKCGESTELRQVFADVVSAWIAKGMSEGLKYGVEHGKANLSLEAIEAYDPEAEAKYITALHALKDLKYPIVDQLESLKDAPMDVIMASLHLDSDTGEDAPQWIRELRPSSSQLKIPVYPEVRDPTDPWACKEEILLADAIAANVSRAKKKKCRVVCRTHGVGSSHHARFDGVSVSVPTVAP